MTETATVIETDILIIGAGPVGMTLALALMQGGSPQRILLLDQNPRGSYTKDPRALALSHGTRQLLETLDAWHMNAGTAIHDIHISQAGGFGRTVITREEQCVEALGYVMRYRDLASALDARLNENLILDASTVLATRMERNGALVTLLRQGVEMQIRTQLIVHAEGAPTESADIRTFDYHQHAVLAEVRPQPAHQQRAWERFTADGPLALLPLGADYSVVFTVPPEKADALMAMDDRAFLGALQQQFGSRLRFTHTSPRAHFPLKLRLRRELCAEREVWIGNAAQTLHPVSGQGFNLGIRDAWELANALLSGDSADPGDAHTLQAYAQHRRIDRTGSAAFTDGIVRVFSNDFTPLRIARGLGLLALDLCPPARKFVAGRMIWGAREI
ncbi:MAG: FAD-dependent monooxygenase [Zoogloeaceae bacterium]|nr:FAD-dependent monooxygenase [Zoogloeaceae bacterium]